MTLGTGKGAGLGRAARAAVLWGIGVTEGNRQRCDWERRVKVISGNIPDSA